MVRDIVSAIGLSQRICDVPQEIKTAILQQTFYFYENRGESAIISKNGIVAELTLIPQTKATLQRFKRV